MLQNKTYKIFEKMYQSCSIFLSTSSQRTDKTVSSQEPRCPFVAKICIVTGFVDQCARWNPMTPVPQDIPHGRGVTLGRQDLLLGTPGTPPGRQGRRHGYDMNFPRTPRSNPRTRRPR